MIPVELFERGDQCVRSQLCCSSWSHLLPLSLAGRRSVCYYNSQPHWDSCYVVYRGWKEQTNWDRVERWLFWCGSELFVRMVQIMSAFFRLFEFSHLLSGQLFKTIEIIKWAFFFLCSTVFLRDMRFLFLHHYLKACSVLFCCFLNKSESKQSQTKSWKLKWKYFLHVGAVLIIKYSSAQKVWRKSTFFWRL